MDGSNRRGRLGRRWKMKELYNNYLHTLSMKAGDREEWNGVRWLGPTSMGIKPIDLDDDDDTPAVHKVFIM